jgi:hypothetical protein
MELFELLLVRHLHQPRGELELLRLVQRQLVPALFEFPERTELGFELLSLQLGPIAVVHRHLRARRRCIHVAASSVPTPDAV